MTGPRIDNDAEKRARAKAAGYTDAEIDEFLARRQTITKPSVDMRGQSERVESSRAPEGYAAQYGKGLVRSAAQGVTAGFADEIEAGARANLHLNPNDANRSYRDIRDDVRGQNDEFARENPGTALAANIAGGVTGGAGVVKAVGAVPKLAALSARMMGAKGTATVSGRILSSAKAGAAAGAVGGAGVAPEAEDMMNYTVGGAAAGGLAGGALGAGIEAFRGARNVVAGVMQGDKAAGPIRKAIRAESPEDAGARRVLSRLGRAKQSVDDVAAASTNAPNHAALAELVDNGHGVSGLRVARNVGRERDVIDRSLSERAAEAPTEYARSISRNTGVAAPRDASAYASEALDEVGARTKRLYAKAAKQPDVADPRIAEAVETLESMPEYGPAALKRARTLAAARGEAFPESMRPPEAPKGATRAPSGGLKDFTKASDDALVSEYEAITTRMQGDMGKAQYRVVESDGATDRASTKILAATGGKGGPSMQAKALQRLKLSQGVLDKIEFELEKRGVDVADAMARRSMAAESSESGKLAALFGDDAPIAPKPTVNAIPVRSMQDLRKGMDEVLGDMQSEIDAGRGSPELFRSMTRIRRQVDRSLKSAGGKAQRVADRLHANASAKGESFKLGQSVESETTPEGIMGKAMKARNPDAFREGSASRQLERLGNVADGEGGQIRNPVQGTMGSPTRRARAATAYPNQEAFNATRADADVLVNQAKTRAAVSGNSTTAANLAEMGDEFDPMTLVNAPLNPTGAAKLLAEKVLRTSGQGLNAQQATAMGKLLGAGLPGQMSRDEALAILRRMEPTLQAQMVKQLRARGAMAGAAVQTGGRPSR